jgi:predicted nucleic acid-binding protein
VATLVDTNILFDLINPTSNWTDWSLRHIRAAAIEGPLYINDIIFAELSTRFATVREVEKAISDLELTILSFNSLSLFLAGKAFMQYRRSGGTRTNVLPDFFIGAQSLAEDLVLLTRDPRRYRTYFPGVTLIAPEQIL